MDMSTNYMGFDLPHPFIPGASPMAGDLDTVRRLEDSGAPMIIMHSIFEEQLVQEELYVDWTIAQGQDSSSEASGYLTTPFNFRLGPEAYLKQLQKTKSAVRVPVIASLNGRTSGGWISYARLLEQAGADGIELNLYDLALTTFRDSSEVERDSLAVIEAVRQAIKIPLAVKLSPFYTSPVHFVAQAVRAGVGSVVIFNRFYQADIDVENLTVKRELKLSTSDELLPRLRWTAAISGQVDCQLAITGGVQNARDAVKCVMAGADAVQVVSALLEYGPAHIAVLRDTLAEWMRANEYTSLKQMKGSMSLARAPEPELFERGNYIRILQGWKQSDGSMDSYWS
jgi:dihydroorotate dehydrogenase (fumarate)